VTAGVQADVLGNVRRPASFAHTAPSIGKLVEGSGTALILVRHDLRAEPARVGDDNSAAVAGAPDLGMAWKRRKDPPRGIEYFAVAEISFTGIRGVAADERHVLRDGT